MPRTSGLARLSAREIRLGRSPGTSWGSAENGQSRPGIVSFLVSLVHHCCVGSCEAADAPEVPSGHRPFSLRRF